jgi:2-polyprenyl-3-methyl-5-hydroxy-6-metoxy-1,4-benzoquinol methylase
MQSRKRVPELMDDPSLSDSEQLHARAGLARINQVTGAAEELWRPILQFAQQRGLSKVSVLDVATGQADVLLRLWRIARRYGIELQPDGSDICATALSQARQTSVRIGAPANFFKLDVLQDRLPESYDVVVTSLFTHHLSEDHTVALLRSMKQAAKHLVIVIDLVRSPANLFCVWLATRVLSTSHVVRFDGPASVRASYTMDELRGLANHAGMHEVEIRELFPCKMMLIWRKDSVQSA